MVVDQLAERLLPIRGPRFEFSHWQTLYYLYIVSYIENDKIKKKRPGMAHFKNQENGYFLSQVSSKLDHWHQLLAGIFGH